MTAQEYRDVLDKATSEFLETGKGEFIVQALVAQLFGQALGAMADPQTLGSLLLNFHRGVEATTGIAEIGINIKPEGEAAPPVDPKTLN